MENGTSPSRSGVSNYLKMDLCRGCAMIIAGSCMHYQSLVYTPVVCVECMSSELASSDVCLYLVLRILERATVCNV